MTERGLAADIFVVVSLPRVTFLCFFSLLQSLDVLLSSNVLITGGAGYIGGHFTLRYLDMLAQAANQQREKEKEKEGAPAAPRGHFIIVDNLVRGSLQTIETLRSLSKKIDRDERAERAGTRGGADREQRQFLSFVQGDAGDSTFMSALLRRHQIDTIVHFAAPCYAYESVLYPLEYFVNVTTGMMGVLFSCAVLLLSLLLLLSVVGVFVVFVSPTVFLQKCIVCSEPYITHTPSPPPTHTYQHHHRCRRRHRHETRSHHRAAQGH